MFRDYPTSSSADRRAFIPIAAIDRRRLLRGMGLLGALAAAGTRISWASAQDAMSSPMPESAVPMIGQRPDGSALWRVQVAGGSMDDGIELMGFYPGEITINAGDAIFFDFSTGMPEIPHTVSFLAGGQVPDLIVPETTGATPMAGASAPRVMFNPEVAFPKGEQTVDGSGPVSSGMNILRPAGTFYVLEFPTPGSYAFVDLVFPMAANGTVTVLEQGAAVPSTQEDYDAATAQMQAPMLESGQALIASFGQPAPFDLGDGTRRWEVTTGATDGTTEVAAFVPDKLTIKAGDTVRWTLEHSMLELHTATFAGDAEPPELLLIEPQESGNPKLILNPALVAAAGEEVYPDADEVVNTGFLSTRFSYPRTSDLVFDTPGEYPYYCAIHGSPNAGMRGIIVVE